VKFAYIGSYAAAPKSSEPLHGGRTHRGGAVVSVARLREAK